MITQTWGLRIYGEPAPKGSLVPRELPGGRVALVEQVGRGKPWRRAIEKAAPKLIPEKAGKHQPIGLDLTFTITKTAAAIAEGRLFPSTQSAEGIGGDADKMVRLVLDALESAKILVNDGQVVRIRTDQYYPGTEYRDQLTRPGLMLRIYPRVKPAPPPAELPYEDKLLVEDGER